MALANSATGCTVLSLKVNNAYVKERKVKVSIRSHRKTNTQTQKKDLRRTETKHFQVDETWSMYPTSWVGFVIFFDCPRHHWHTVLTWHVCFSLLIFLFFGFDCGVIFYTSSVHWLILDHTLNCLDCLYFFFYFRSD